MIRDSPLTPDFLWQKPATLSHLVCEVLFCARHGIPPPSYAAGGYEKMATSRHYSYNDASIGGDEK